MSDLAAPSWIARDGDVVWHGFTQMSCYAESTPVLVERAEGRELIDVDGRRYLDAISSLWVTTLGHRVPELDEALRDQLDKVAHSTMLGNGNRATVELTEALVPRLPVDDPHVLYASDGAAAVEQALKLAFQYWANRARAAGSGRTGAGRTGFLALGGAYHGDTIGALSLGAGGFGTDIFDPLRFPVVRAPGYDDPDWADATIGLLDAHAPELAAFVLEPLVQGAAGIHVAHAPDVSRVVAAAQARGVLVIADEVATGFGRTGTLFASEQCGIRPDLLVVGKGITGGYLPLSATVANRRVYDGFLGPDLSEATFYHGHSYSGNALACAVARRHLDLIVEGDVLANVGDRADQLAKLLDERVAPSPAVGAIRQRGLMVGVELAPLGGAPERAIRSSTPGAEELHDRVDRGADGHGLRWGRRVCAEAVRRGVLLRPLGDVVVLMPMLTSTAPEIERIVDTLAAAIESVASRNSSEGP